MDYPAWCGLIRGAVFWATGQDPCESRKLLVANDEESNLARGVVAGWKSLCEARNQDALTVAEAPRDPRGRQGAAPRTLGRVQ